MINLNIYQHKDIISGEVILSAYSSLDIFRFYIDNELVPYKLIKSPLRDETNSSFIIFKHYNGNYFFKDFGGKTGDCFHFVSLLFKYNNYAKAVSRVGIDFNFDDRYFCNIKYKKQYYIAPIKYDDKYNKEKASILVTRKSWDKNLYEYWDAYGISKNTLEKYNVYPISYFFINDKIFKADKIAFVYYEYKDNIVTKKIYQPYNFRFKFIAEHDYSVIDGFSQLPDKDNLLIITKSRKDLMAINELTNISVIGTQGETVLIKENVINDLKDRFKNIITIFDNDKTGIELKNNYLDRYNIDGFIFDKKKYDIKDSSDLIKKYKKKKSYTIIINEIKKVLNA